MIYKEYAIAVRGDYYTLIGSNSINMMVIVWSFSWLSQNSYKEKETLFETYKQALFEEGYLNSVGEGFMDYGTSASLEAATHTIHFISNFPVNQRIVDAVIKVFPQYSQEFLEDHEYVMSLENYLEILRKVFEYYEAKIEFIIFYVDDAGKVQCEPYYPTQEDENKYMYNIANICFF